MAVLAVVVYHAFPDWLPGGFLGVDVFFVISGYLISTILFGNLEQGTFSLAQFYARRIRRIYPALLVVLTATYALGWFALLAEEYEQLGKHIASGAGFVSNLVLWSEGGYFDRSGETKPLLHLWSLGVEEQFYIVWPLLLWASWRRRFVLPTILALGIVSFLACVLWSRSAPLAAFYSPVTRFWELLAGAGLAWMTLRNRGPLAVREKGRTADGLSAAGLAMLACAFLFVPGDASFWTGGIVVSVAATAMLIAGGPATWVNRHLLSNRPAVGLGLVSFSLYLWHWPLLSLARIVNARMPGAEWRAAAIALALFLAWLTYRLIEVPVRFGGNLKAKAAACGALMVFMGAVGLHTFVVGGIASRDVAQLNAMRMNGSVGGDGGLSVDGCGIEDPADRDLFAKCARDRRGDVRLALMGDSKAASLYPGVLRTSGGAGRWMIIGGFGDHGAPVPLLSNDAHPAPSQHLTTAAVQAISRDKHIRTVVIVAAVRSLFNLDWRVRGGNVETYDYRYLDRLEGPRNYDRALDGFSRTISEFVASGKDVVLLVDNPPLPNPEDCYGRRTSLDFVNGLLTDNEDCVLPLERFEAQIRIYRKLLAELKARHGNAVEIFDPTDIYCDVASGTCGARRNGRLLYSATDHISEYGAVLVGQRLNRFLEERANHAGAAR